MERAELISAAMGLHKLFYGPHDAFCRINDTRWLGTEVQKCPFDLLLYQEIVFETGPDLIIETGTAGGGSALFLASICRLLGKGEVLTIDLNEVEVVDSIVTQYVGDSVADKTIRFVRERSAGKKNDGGFG